MSYFYDGMMKLQNGDYKKCLLCMRDCYWFIEEVKYLLCCYGGDLKYELLEEVEILEKDVFYYICVVFLV